MYQVASGGLEPTNIANPIRRRLQKNKNVRFIMANVTGIDTKNNKIIGDEGELDYDYLVLATGSTNNYFNFEPIKDRLFTMKSVDDALEIRSRIMQNLEALNYTPEKNKMVIINQ